MWARIAAVVAQVEPDLDEAVIAAAVAKAAPNLRHAVPLDKAVAVGPKALLGGSVAPVEVDRLVAELRGAGANTVLPPTCFRCGTTRWLDQRVDGLRACAPCAARARGEVCGRCGIKDRVAIRDLAGRPVCNQCRSKEPCRAEECVGCGRTRPVVYRGGDGAPMCESCGRPHPIVACSVCGKTRPAANSGRRSSPKCSSCAKRRARCSVCGSDDRHVAMVFATGPVCSTCHKKALSAKGVCNGCGQLRRIDPRAREQRGLCSDCAGLPAWSVCSVCGAEDRVYDAGRCMACTLEHRLGELIGSAAVLEPLRKRLLATDRPRAALRWLSRKEVSETLAALASGELLATHEALDELPDTRWLGHLRQVLVTGGVLPERDEPTARLETWIRGQIDAMEVAEDRRVVDAFANWWVLRRYRSRLNRKGASSDSHPRSQVLAAIAFLAWCRDHETTLGSSTQAHVELWLVGAPRRRWARDFLRWACRRGLAHNLDIMHRHQGTPARSVDADEHLTLARRFAAEESLPLADRVAGLLLLCYGQPLTRLAKLTADHIVTNGHLTSIRFGRTRVEVSDPVGELLRTLPTDGRTTPYQH